MNESANSRQVGGGHYQRQGIQHWDLMAQARAGYFAGQVTKYTERHSKKNGRQDLEKALHFAEKMHEVREDVTGGWIFKRRGRTLPYSEVSEAIRDYAVDAGLSALQERIFEACLLTPDSTHEIVTLCKKHLDREYGEPELVENAKAPIPVDIFGRRGAYVSPDFSPAAQSRIDFTVTVPRPGTPEDGGHHESIAVRTAESDLPVDLPVDVAEALEADVVTQLVEAIEERRSTAEPAKKAK